MIEVESMFSNEPGAKTLVNTLAGHVLPTVPREEAGWEVSENTSVRINTKHGQITVATDGAGTHIPLARISDAVFYNEDGDDRQPRYTFELVTHDATELTSMDWYENEAYNVYNALRVEIGERVNWHDARVLNADDE